MNTSLFRSGPAPTPIYPARPPAAADIEAVVSRLLGDLRDARNEIATMRQDLARIREQLIRQHDLHRAV